MRGLCKFGVITLPGYSAKFIGADPHTASMGHIHDADLWEENDGMMFIKSLRWWNEEGTLIDLTKKLLNRYHPDEAEDIIRSGVGYLGTGIAYQLVEIIREAVEKVGPENYNSKSLYDAAKSFSLTIDGVERYGFTETERTSVNYYALYEVSAFQKDICRVDPEWCPAIYGP